MSVDPAKNFSGMSKAGEGRTSKPYSMNRRAFQVFANKVLYDCQDSRDDDKDSFGAIVAGTGIKKFSVLEEGQRISFSVAKIDTRSGMVYELNTDI